MQGSEADQAAPVELVLTSSNVVHYLAERRLLSRASLLEEPLRIEAGSGRHRNFGIRRGAEPGFFVKQVKSWESAAQGTLRREADWYRLVSEFDRCSALRQFMPAFHRSDDQRSILVIELIENAESLLSLPPERGWRSLAVANAIGVMMATVHSLEPQTWPVADYAFEFPYRFPGALTLDQRVDRLDWLAPGEQAVMRTLQSHPEFAAHLNALRAKWEMTTVIHCDFRWNNVLRLEPAEGAPDLRLIDWELVDCGDPAWDVGGVLQAWLSSWIRSMPQRDLPAHELVRAAALPIESMQPAIAAFWKAYSEARGFNNAEARLFLERSVSYGAARMLQSALESVQGQPFLSRGALCGLQVALNTLDQPSVARSDLLGLS